MGALHQAVASGKALYAAELHEIDRHAVDLSINLWHVSSEA